MRSNRRLSISILLVLVFVLVGFLVLEEIASEGVVKQEGQLGLKAEIESPSPEFGARQVLHSDPDEDTSVTGGIPPPAILRVLVVQQDSQPLTGASVHLFRKSLAHLDLGRTTEDGSLDIDMRELEGSQPRVVATKAGYSPSSRLIPRGSQELRLVLHPAATISGQVTFGGVSLRLEGLRVIAEDPASSAFDRSRVFRTDDPELAALGATTDDNGRFVIQGVRADRSYHLYAGGRGFYSRERAHIGSSGPRSESIIAVEKVYGAITRFVDEHGADAHFPPALRNGGWWRSLSAADQSRPEESTPLDPSLPFLGLSGLDPFLISDLPPAFGLVLESTRVDYPRISDRVDAGRPPGYEEYSVTYPLLPLEGVSRRFRSFCVEQWEALVRFDCDSSTSRRERSCPWNSHPSRGC